MAGGLRLLQGAARGSQYVGGYEEWLERGAVLIREKWRRDPVEWLVRLFHFLGFGYGGLVAKENSLVSRGKRRGAG